MAISKLDRDRRRRDSRAAGAARNGSWRASLSYLTLARQFPIRPIRTEEELDAAIRQVDSLLSRKQPLDAQEQGYLDSLSHEIERYEETAHPMPAVSGAEMLRHLTEARDATLSDVAKGSGIALSTLSAVLHKKRRLNLTHMARLGTYFGVAPSVFMD